MFEAHFQTFEEPESGVALTARLSAVREELETRIRRIESPRNADSTLKS